MKDVWISKLFLTFCVSVGCVILISHNGLAKEQYRTVTIGDTTYTNVTVSKTNAAEITVLFDGGGMVIRREELPEPLRSKYPHDPEAALAFERERAARSKALSEQERASVYAGLLRKEKALQTAITRADSELVELQKEIIVRSNQAKGRRPRHPARIALDQLRERKIGLNRYIEQLQHELIANRAFQTYYR